MQRPDLQTWRLGPWRVITINLTVAMVVIVVVLLRRRTAPRTRADEVMTALAVLMLGVLIAPTPVGHAVVQAIGKVASSITRSAPHL